MIPHTVNSYMSQVCLSQTKKAWATRKLILVSTYATHGASMVPSSRAARDYPHHSLVHGLFPPVGQPQRSIRDIDSCF